MGSYLLIQAVLEGSSPQEAIEEAILGTIDAAYEKFGENKVRSYLTDIADWIDGDLEDSDVIERTLVKNVHILRYMSPPPKVGSFLYRGMIVENIPKKGDTVVYTPENPYTSWSTDRNVAKGFATWRPGRGILLTVPSSEVLKQKLILWPLSLPVIRYFRTQGFDRAVKLASTQKEWFVKIVKPIKVKSWKLYNNT